jgi:esterase/lipase
MMSGSKQALSESDSEVNHLVFLIHGLHGSSMDLEHMATSLRSKFGKQIFVVCVF